MPRYTGELLDDEEYRRLLAFRDGLRRFEHWSELSARAAGLTPAQHQLLLAVRGHGDPRGPTVGDIAGHLLLHHHSAVGLVERTVSSGLVSRHEDRDDRRVVRVRLTARGAAALAKLSALHLEELSRLAGRMTGIWRGLEVPPRHRRPVPERRAPRRRGPGGVVTAGARP